MNKKLLMGIIAGIGVVALVLGLVLGLNNCAGTTDPTVEPTPTGTVEPTDPTEKPTKPQKETEGPTDPPEPGGISYYSGLPDFGWYDEDEIYEEYTLYTADQFMAFVELVNGMGVNFKDVTIKLGANFVFNNGDASKWTRDDEELLNWTPIGSKEANYFAGNIDGQGYYISGLYGVKGRDNGFILYTQKSTIQNLAIVNSYFCNTGGNQKDAQVLGTFVGRGYGVTLKNLYTDAILEGGGYHTGGIVAFARDTWTLNKVEDSKDVYIDSCVFAGTIKGCVGANVGGIIGGTDGQNVKLISNCLNLGTIESSVASVGGIAGSISKETVMTNCVNAGKVVSADKNCDRVALVGNAASSATVKDSYFANIPGAKPFGAGSPTSSGVLGVARASMKGSKVSTAMPGLDFKATWTAYKDDYAIPTGVVNMYDALKKTVVEDTGNGGAVWKNQTGSTDTGKADISWYKEGQTTFTLTTADQLYGLAQLVNEGKTTFKGVTIKLGADIIVNTGDASKWDGETSGLRAWKSIGTSASKHFAGTLDGQGHYISGLYSRMDRDGGFICYAMNATVKNLAIVNSYFENYGRQHANGYLSAQVLATFVGRAYGTTLQNLYSDARLVIPETAVGFNTGGIAAFAKSNGTQSEVEYGASLIDSCVFAGTITTNNEKDELTGGILGSTDGSYTVIKNCLNRGQIISKGKNYGGIAGKLDKESVMEDCVNVGNVDNKVALIGNVTGTVEVKDCYYVKVTGGKAYIGTPKTAQVTALTRDEMKGTNVGTVMTGLDFKSAWTALKDDYPIPTGVKALYAKHKQPIPGGESDGSTSGGESGGESGSTHVPGTPDTTWYEDGKTEFTLTTADELFGFAQLVNEGTSFQGVTIKLGADIVINEGDSSTWGTTAPSRKWTPIGSGNSAYFAGTFDGQGHYISGLYTAEQENNGLFGWVANGEIKNVAIINSYFKATGRSENRNGQMLASFAARAYGTSLKNLYSNATLHYAVGPDHKGDWCTAGIAAIVTSPAVGKTEETQDSINVTGQGKIENCVFTGTILTGEANSSTGAAVGGILGSANGKPITIKNCLFAGQIESNDKQVGGIAGIIANGSTLESCVSAGTIVAASQDVTIWGAIVGESGGTVSVKNCYYSAEQNLPLYGKKATITDENTNTELSADKLMGQQVTTTMNKLTFGADGWTAQENDYPVPTGVVAMYQAHKKPHVHDWADAWTSDETHHWHNCGNVGCDVTDPAQKKDYGAHAFDNDKDRDCNTCGYVREIPDANDGAAYGEVSKYSGYIGGDNSWYKPESGATEYVLTNADQLFGLAYLVNVQGVTFEGITVKLGVNMVINEGDASTWGTTPPETKWRPIGINWTNCFKGTLDGQGHYISGLYNVQESNNGFIYCAQNATVKNLAIVNSYFENTNGEVLSTFMGKGRGAQLQNLYSDAILVGGTQQIGGIAAYVQGAGYTPAEEVRDCYIKNCVFAGTINGGSTQNVGGIVGANNNEGKVLIENCLNLGTVNSTATNSVAGIIGHATNGTVVKGCVNVGAVVGGNADTTGNAIIGSVNHRTKLSDKVLLVQNCYYVSQNNTKDVFGSNGSVTLTKEKVEAITDASAKGLQVTTTMANLTFGEKGWTAQEGDYPVPTSMKIMVNTLRKLTADAAAPVINTQPTMDNLTVEAESVDGGALTYQWYMSTDGTNFTKIDGATGASHTHDATLTGNTWYKCEVTNTNNNTTSSVKTAKVESNVVKVHTHTEATTMSKDSNGHWYACTVADCDAAVESLPSYEAHDYDGDTDATCNVAECGYERHLHNWNSTWTYDDTHGWHECGNNGCDVTEAEDKDGYHAHAFNTSTGEAVCDTCAYKRVVSVYSGTPDKSWYNDAETEFVLTHADQLYGLISLVNTDGVYFNNKTIKLAVNIVLNEGDARTWNASTTGLYGWTPVGTSWSNAFSGTLDGQNHYISGLYCNATVNNALFGFAVNATVENLALVNSYQVVPTTGTSTEILGSFVGKGAGVHLDTLYSSSILEGGYQCVGGIVARPQSTGNGASRTVEIKNCVFAGQINNAKYERVGGIVGEDASGGGLLIENCLNLGDIRVTANRYTGGIVGYARNGLKVKNSVSIGYISTGYAIIGYSNNVSSQTDKNVYIENCYYIGSDKTAATGSANAAITEQITNVSSIADASAKGDQVTTTMANLGFSENWTARTDDYPVPTSILPLLQNVPVNADAPVIRMQPGSFGYDAATDTVTPLEITAESPDGGVISYQWYSNTTLSNVGGTLIEGATEATYTPSLNGMEAGDAQYFYCVVTNTNTQMTGVQVVTNVSNPVCVHIHEVDTSSYTGHSATQHWSACTVDGCGVAAGHEDHDAGADKTCATCGWLKANYYAGGSDTSWYTSNPNASEYVLTTPAQLYGLKDLVNGGTTKFEGKTIKLGANMVFNVEDASTYGTTAPAYSWTPIGDNESSRYFAGTFDGQGHYLSGLYYSKNRDGGFFSWTRNATIENFAIINTYFVHHGQRDGTPQNGQGLATFVGRGDGATLRNLYSEAILENIASNNGNTQSTWFTGGIAAFVYKKNASVNPVVEGCVFAGEIIETANGAGEAVGGIVGGDDGKAITIKNCLFSGKLSSNDNKVGGIIGRVTNASTKVENCVVVGELNCVRVSSGSAETNIGNWGAVVGHTTQAISIKNCYYDPSAMDNTGTPAAITLPLYGSLVTAAVTDVDTNTSLSRESMKGDAATTNMPKLFEGQTPAWQVVTDGYPIPVGVVIP